MYIFKEILCKSLNIFSLSKSYLLTLFLDKCSVLVCECNKLCDKPKYFFIVNICNYDLWINCCQKHFVIFSLKLLF